MSSNKKPIQEAGYLAGTSGNGQGSAKSKRPAWFAAPASGLLHRQTMRGGKCEAGCGATRKASRRRRNWQKPLTLRCGCRPRRWTTGPLGGRKRSLRSNGPRPNTSYPTAESE